MYVSFVHTCGHVSDVSWWFIVLFLYCHFSLRCLKHRKGDTTVGVSLCFSPGVVLWPCGTSQAGYRRQWSHHVALWHRLAARRIMTSSRCTLLSVVALWRHLVAHRCQWSHYDVISLHTVVSGHIMTSRCTRLSVVALWRHLVARGCQWSHDDVISLHAVVSGRTMTSSRCTLLSRRIMTPRSVGVLRDRIVVTGNIMNSHRGQCYPGFQKEKWYENISS